MTLSSLVPTLPVRVTALTSWDIPTVSIFRSLITVSGMTYPLSASGFLSLFSQEVKAITVQKRRRARRLPGLAKFCIKCWRFAGLVKEVSACIIIDVFECANAIEQDGI